MPVSEPFRTAGHNYCELHILNLRRNIYMQPAMQREPGGASELTEENAVEPIMSQER